MALSAEPPSTLDRHGVVLPHRRGRRGYGLHLSSREQEVARHVALGRTNKEIAAIVFLSPRTVEDHVASASANSTSTPERR